MLKSVLLLVGVSLCVDQCISDVISLDGEMPDEVQTKNANQRSLFLMNLDIYWRWPDRNEILYYIDGYYNPQERNWIRQAASFIQRDLLGCIALREADPRDRRPKIRVTPFLYHNQREDYCKAYPGYRHSAAKNGRDQLFVVPRGPKSCLNESLVGLMKGWAISLGRLNEHQRWDRNDYIRLHPENIQFPEAYRRYDFLQAYVESFWMGLPYDACSITHNRPTAFSRPGTVAFTFRRGPQAVPDIPRLSQTDCQLISHMYGCNPRVCRSWDCENARQNASWASTSKPTTVSTVRPTTPSMRPNTTVTTARPITTPATSTARTAPAVSTAAGSTSKPVTGGPFVTSSSSASTVRTSASTSTRTTTLPTPSTDSPIPTTTTAVTTTAAETTTLAPKCTLQPFCQGKIDEASFLLGPYIPFQTYLFFSGECIMEYTVNWTSSFLRPIGDPELIVEYFPMPGGPSIVPPVTPVYLTKNLTTEFFDLNLINKGGSSTLVCQTNPEFDTHAASCPIVSGPNNRPGTAGISSISSMLNVGDFLVYHYVVDNSKKEIKLMDANFQNTYQTTQGLLANQKEITSITAIQILMDENDIHPVVMGIIGTGVDGKTYAGVVDMPITAHPNVTLSPITWYYADGNPLLSAKLEGC